MARRASLRDRDSAAIATHSNLPAPPQPAPVVQDQQADPPAAAPAAVPRETAPPATGRGEAGKDTRISLYLHPDTYRDSRAAYVVDFEQPDPATSYAGWIAAAVAAHACLRPQERTELADSLPDVDRAGVGLHRSVKVPVNIQLVMDAARRDDRIAGRVIGRSAFAHEAILSAIDQARGRVGGVLPEPPARLPKNLA